MAVNPDKYQVIIVGAGSMGLSIAKTLLKDPRFSVCFIDPVEEVIKTVKSQGYEALETCGTNREKMLPLLKDADAVVVAAPNYVVPHVARMAIEMNCHFIDLCEEAAIFNEVVQMSQNATSNIVPQCGLAPGFVSWLVSDIIRDCGPEAEIKVYVGALPKQKTNRLGYGKIWGVDGLITEYTKACSAIIDGQKTSLKPLTEYEELTINGVAYEAFTTAGSLDGLIDQFDGKVKSLTFKTLRYTGHLDYIKFLLDDLDLKNRISFLRNLLLNGLNIIEQDQVIIGIISKQQIAQSVDHSLKERSHFQFIHSEQQADGSYMSAISIASAAHVCCVIDILCSGLAPNKGLLHHFDLDRSLLIESQFYQYLK